jgi:ubiquitin-like protein Pup
MAEREKKRAQPAEQQADETDVVDEAEVQGEELTDRIDDLLDEIDSVLEENAEEFVKNYVQKGGE